MSQVSKSKALRPEKVRKKVAWEIAGRVELYWDHGGICQSLGWTDAAAALLDPRRGLHFDVHAAREHARSLVALADEQAAFEEFCGFWGKGPENRAPGVFTGHLDWMPVCEECSGSGSCEFSDEMVVHDVRECPHCEGSGEVRGGWPGNLAREWARQGGDRRAPMGRSLARLGQHILDAIEGQASECRACEGTGEHAAYEREDDDDPGNRPDCKDCQGTGHNLAGYLPPVEVSTQLRRKVADSCAAMGDRVDGWTAFHPAGDVEYGQPTRVTPRGEHDDEDWLLWRQETIPLMARPDLLPRWRRRERNQ